MTVLTEPSLSEINKSVNYDLDPS